MLHVALYQPVIPQNVGNIARTCVGMNAHLHIIGPTIIDFSDKAVRRAGLDYWDDLTITEHESPAAFFDWANKPSGSESGTGILPVEDTSHRQDACATRERRIYLVTKFATQCFDAPAYRDGDILLFGSEREGLPRELHDRFDDDAKIAIPIPGEVRSYNLGNAVAIVLAAAMSNAKLWPSEWEPKEGYIAENTFPEIS